MLKYPCLVMDHDDTTVDSTATVHYPCFVEYMEIYHPDKILTLEEYFRYNFHPGVVPMFTEICGMTLEEMYEEEAYWRAYVEKHVPKAYPGIREILEEQRRRGGKICVVSHSFSDNIRRDFRENNLPEPDLIFGWERPPEQRKPAVNDSNILEELGNAIAGTLSEAVVKVYVKSQLKVENHYVLNVGKMYYDGEKRVVTIGAFNHVFCLVKAYDLLDEMK